MREERTEVLVVGAGPVGLVSSLLLAKQGMQVTVVDRESRTAARSYACALHPQTLEILDSLELARPLINAGRKIERIAFYNRAEKKAEVNISKLNSPFPYMLVLPQSVLEKALEDRLTKYGIAVNWNHRLTDIATGVDAAEATIEELAWGSRGYSVPHSELQVKRQAVLRAQVVLGADGHYSTVRQRAGIDFQRFGSRQHFAAYEFETEGAAPNELRIALDATSTSVLWPLPDNHLRWTFQVTQGYDEWPEKDRQGGRVSSRQSDRKIREFIEEVCQERAPWFESPVKEVTWSARVSFERCLARQFGRGQCWLAGDAAHQTGPAGAQSMNSGFAEAAALVKAMDSFINRNGSRQLLDRYQSDFQGLWRKLLGLDGPAKLTVAGQPWLRDNVHRIIPCLPGLGESLTSLAGQLQISVD